VRSIDVYNNDVRIINRLILLITRTYEKLSRIGPLQIYVFIEIRTIIVCIEIQLYSRLYSLL